MSCADILRKCGLTPDQVRKIASRNCTKYATIAQAMEAKYNPDGISDAQDMIDRQADADKQAMAMATADFGAVSNGKWELNTRIGGL